MVVSAASTLEEELDRLRLDVWLVEMRVLTMVSAASMLDDELERESELALAAESAASTLEEEPLKLRLEV